MSFHDDVIKWKHFQRYWSFVWGILRSPVNSPRKGQWRGALMFSLICARINAGESNREAGDLRRHCVHYDVIVMHFQGCDGWRVWKQGLAEQCIRRVQNWCYNNVNHSAKGVRQGDCTYWYCGQFGECCLTLYSYMTNTCIYISKPSHPCFKIMTTVLSPQWDFLHLQDSILISNQPPWSTREISHILLLKQW